MIEEPRGDTCRHQNPSSSRLGRPLPALALLVIIQASGCATPAIDAITFAGDPKKIYLPIDEVVGLLGWRVNYDDKRGRVHLGKRAHSYQLLRQMTDGTRLVTLTDLAKLGASVTRGKGGMRVDGGKRKPSFAVVVGSKKAEVNLATQRLRAWQGARLVLDSRISSGRGRSTPAGNFTAGPYKARRHYSSRYDNAPMPWSVQVTGHIFIHGFTSVPSYPASHGCIRLPLSEGNPARFFYEWIDRGIPIRIRRK